jgi:uncharacterized protein YjbI with pentapeptide repeats
MKGKNIIWFLFILMFSATAFAAGHYVTYDFDSPAGVKDVDVLAYTCTLEDNDGVCTELGEMSKYNGNSRIIKKNNKEVAILFPSELESQYGYVLFFTAKDSEDNDYVPIEIRTNTRGNAQTTIKASQNPLFRFSRIDVCSAEVSQMQILVEQDDDEEGNPSGPKAGVPIIIDSNTTINTTINSTTKSAFRKNDNGISINIVPQELKDKHLYSANTDVKLVIKKDDEVEYSPEEKNYKIFVDETVNPNWQWTPEEAGIYNVRITSTIDDTKCVRAEDRFASQNVEIFNETPESACLSSIWGLEILERDVFDDELFTIRFNWNSYNKNGNENGLKYTWQIIDEEDEIVSSGIVYNTYNQPETKQIRAPRIGKENNVPYTLRIIGETSDTNCEDPRNSQQEMNFIVKQFSNSHTLGFTILRQSGSSNIPLRNAEIEILNELTKYGEEVKELTDSDGKAEFELLEKTYEYEIKKSGYRTRQGEINLNQNRYLTLTLYESGTNTAPEIWLQDSYNIVTGNSLNINLNNFVSDDMDRPEQIEWTVNDQKTKYTGTIIEINNINTNNIIINTRRIGSETVTFKAKDTEGAERTKDVTFNVLSVDTTPPIWDEDKIKQKTPIILTEEEKKPFALNLHELASDNRDSPEELSYTITKLEFEYDHISQEYLETASGVIIQNNKYLSILPDGDFFGNITATISARDLSGNSKATIVNIEITNINDAPIKAEGRINNGNLEIIPKELELTKVEFDYTEQIELDLTKYFFDIDEFYNPTIDSLTYGVSQDARYATLTINQERKTLTISSKDNRAHNDETFNLWATDKAGERAIFTNVSIITTEGNFAPEIKDLFTHIEMNEDETEMTFYVKDENGNIIRTIANNVTQHALVRYAEDYETPQKDLIWSAENYDTELITIEINNDDENKYLTINPIKDAFGETTATLKVTDEGGKTDEKTITITIERVNDAPTITLEDSYNIEFSSEIQLTLTAEDDADSQENLDWTVNDEKTFSGDYFDITINNNIASITATELGFETVTFKAEDTEGAESEEKEVTFTIIDTTPPEFSNQINPQSEKTYSETETKWLINVNDNIEVGIVKFFLYEIKNDFIDLKENIIIDENIFNDIYKFEKILDAGNYEYQWYAEDTEGNVAMTEVNTITVNPAEPIMILKLNGTDEPISIPEANLPLDVEIEGTLTKPSEGNLKIYINDEEIESNNDSSNILTNHQFNETGNYIVRFEYTDSTNATNYKANHSITHNVIIQDDFTPPEINEITKPSSSKTYNPTEKITWSVTATDEYLDTVEFFLNGESQNPINNIDDEYSFEAQGLEVGNYTYYWKATDKSLNENTTEEGNLEITQAEATINVSFNGNPASNTVLEEGSDLIINATITEPTENATMELFIDAGQGYESKANGSTEEEINYILTDLSGEEYKIKIVASTTNPNYKETTKEYTITIGELPLQRSNYNPENNSEIEFSYADLSFETNKATTCKWSLTDIAYSTMTNNFTESTGDNGENMHSAQIQFNVENLNDLGNHKVYVACEGETAEENTELTYKIINVLDESNIDQESKITTSIVTESNVTESEITTSTVTKSNVTESQITLSTVRNSTLNICNFNNVTFLDSDCENSTITDAYINPSKIKNSTISGDSKIINSEIIDSTIIDSNIYNSTITNNSEITNSTIEGVTLENATVEDNKLKNGTIIYTNDNGDEETFILDNPKNDPEKWRDLDEFFTVTYPTAAFTYTPTAPEKGQIVTFNAGTSIIPNITGYNKTEVIYAWTFGDGSTGTGITTTHTYTVAGTYTATLKITATYESNDGTSNLVRDDSTSKQITIKEPTITPATPTTPTPVSGSGGGGGGGSSGMKTITVTNTATDITFRTYDLIRINLNNVLYPTMISIYQLDTDKATLLINGIRHELHTGETKEFDLNKDGIMDVSITGIAISKSTATLRFLPAGITEQITTPLPIFDIPIIEEKQEEKVEEKPTEEIKEDAEDKEEIAESEITVKVGSAWDKIVNSFKKIFGTAKEGEADVGGSGFIAMAIIAGVVLIGIGTFFVIKKVYFY